MATPIAAVFSGKMTATSGLKLHRSILDGVNLDTSQRDEDLCSSDAGIDSEEMLHPGTQSVVLLDLVAVTKTMAMSLVANDPL